jgi:hypothetical protein
VVSLATALALLVAWTGVAAAAPAQERYPARWSGQASWQSEESKEDDFGQRGVKRKESSFVVTMRSTFGKARGYSSTYEVKSGSLTWKASGSSYELLKDLTETTCSWKVSRTVRLTKYAGALQVERHSGRLRGVFAAADSFGSARVPRTCTTKYLYGRTPPVETSTYVDDLTPPNPLFPLSRKTAGLPARGVPLVIAGSDRASFRRTPPSGPGVTITERGASRWSWRFRASG